MDFSLSSLLLFSYSSRFCSSRISICFLFTFFLFSFSFSSFFTLLFKFLYSSCWLLPLLRYCMPPESAFSFSFVFFFFRGTSCSSVRCHIYSRTVGIFLSYQQQTSLPCRNQFSQFCEKQTCLCRRENNKERKDQGFLNKMN